MKFTPDGSQGYFRKKHWWSRKQYMCPSCEHKFELNILLGENNEKIY